LSRGKLFVISAPAGTGKTTLAEMLVTRLEDVTRSISCTTRKPRGKELDGVDYHFLSKETFAEKVKKNEFLEHAQVYTDQYGTLKKDVEELRKSGQTVLLVIDTQGAKQVKEHSDAELIFIMPPSIEELESRLRGRNTESETSLEKRLAWAKQEIERAKLYDYVILNQDLELAFAHLSEIVGKR